MTTLADRLRRQGEQCGLSGSPLYEVLLTGAADDLEAGGPTADVLAGVEDEPSGSVPALRFTGALHRLVLERRAPGLAVHYPSVGGTAGPEGAWLAARSLLVEQGDEVRRVMAHPVQTNEPARSAVLFGGLLVLAARVGLPVRLLELGASGGLNLHVDRYAYRLGDAVHGDAGSALMLTDPWSALTGPPALPVVISERAGCDRLPVDVMTTEGRLTLTSFVWADQVHRLARLRAALQVAQAHPVVVQRTDASSFLAERLARPCPGVLTLVWHSVVWQYLSGDEQQRVQQHLGRALAAATPSAPVAHLAMEPVQLGRGDYRFRLYLTLSDGGQHSGGGHAGGGTGREVLADCEGHGPPVRWCRTA